MLGELVTRVSRKGFVGPRYGGAAGKVRFLLESTIARQELFFLATPESVARAEPPRDLPLELHSIARFEDLAPFAAGLEAEYYPGYAERWRAPFTWGERAVVGTLEGRVACFNWMQVGTAAGFPTYWGRLFEHEARLVRGGVAPAFRRLGLNTLMKRRLLERFFDSGVRRVYAECYKNNIPSVRTLLRLGFRAAGVITIIELPPLRSFVRWKPVHAVAAEFRALGIELE